MRLQDRVALITGAGSGIGRAMAGIFAREGARVFVADVDLEAARETASGVAEQGGHAASFHADVSKSEDVNAMVAACVERYGRIDILCNNAGLGSTQTVVDTPDEVWDRVFAVNVRGTFLGCKHAIPRMIEHGGGVIINTASVAGLVGLKDRAAYCAAKGAIVALTRAVALDHVQQNIRCVCICPGTVDSPWVGRLLDGADDPEAARAALIARQPMGRLGTPEEIALAALYLASDDAAFITGSPLIIDGGLTMQ
jgi:NAD(P)-dependent dehydrogenase (short-subunit alcohol dehydrogenase family)